MSKNQYELDISTKMRLRFFRRRFFIGKMFLAVCMLVLLGWLYWADGTTFNMEQKLLRLSPFLGGFDTSLLYPTSKCTSTAKRINVTANFTVNNMLDSLQLSFRGNQMLAKLKPHKAILGYEEAMGNSRNQNIQDPLEIIVIPHSHNDPGWKKTYMKYFMDQTTHILTNIVNKLTQYPDMTFIWVESCFLNTWWQNQTSIVREKFKTLVKEGRLEIVSGMWVAPDEASPHYFALLDQMIEGHYWVKKNLDVVPESSLNFDQFGYSTTMPYLAKKAGLKQILIKRIHRGLKLALGDRKWMNFNWRQLFYPEGEEDIFSLVDTYEWMSISDSCGPDRAICRGLDFSLMPDLPTPGTPRAARPFRSDLYTTSMARNLHDFISKLVQQFKLKRANYQPNVIMLPHGGDFYYAKSEDWDKQYRNLKLFMSYVNDRQNEFNVRMRFGTIKDYFEEVEKQTAKYDLKYPTISGDFFTYTENTEYWTGYFTTRMFDKRLGRELLESLRCAELFVSIVLNDENADHLPKEIETKMISDLISARQNLSIFQHHDAITGTSQAHVAIDYERRLSAGIKSTQMALSSAVQYLIQDGYHSGQNGHVLSNLQRTAYDELTKQLPIHISLSGTKVFLVNSLPQKRHDLVSLVIETEHVVLLDPNGAEVGFDVSKTPEGEAQITFEVHFPPVSVLVFTLQRAKSAPGSGQPGKTAESTKQPNDVLTCANNYMNVTFSASTGLPLSVCNKIDKFCTRLEFEMIHYEGTGGAYTMMSDGHERPVYTSNRDVHVTNALNQCSITAKYVYISVTVSLQKTDSASARALSIDVFSDLTLAHGFKGDLALRVKCNIDNNDKFYVDSNGFQLIGRKFRSSLRFDGNVYPMSSMAMVEDEELRLVVHSAQPHGVVSRSSGTIDFMIDRVAPRPEMDMPEGVIDSKPTKTKFLLEINSNTRETLSTDETALPSIRSVYLNDLLQHPIFSLYSTNKLNISKTSNSYLKHELPCDIIIANIKNLAGEYLNPEGTSMTLFRRGVNCDKGMQSNVCRLFEEPNLQPGALLGRNFKHVLKTTEMYLSHLMSKKTIFEDDGVTLNPMDMKTFLLH